MLWYSDIATHVSDNYTESPPISYPGVGFIDTVTKSPVPQPDNEPFILLNTTSSTTENVVIVTGSDNLKNVFFSVVLEVRLPRNVAGGAGTLYTPAAVIPIEQHFDSFMLQKKIAATNDSVIFPVFSGPKRSYESSIRSDEHFYSYIIEYNYQYRYCG